MPGTAAIAIRLMMDLSNEMAIGLQSDGPFLKCLEL